MSEATLILQYTNTQREERPKGFRLWSDGRVQRASEANPLPSRTERIDVERQIEWTDARTLEASQLEQCLNAIRQANFSAMSPKMLINYCKEDPGAGLWIVNLDGQHWRVLVYDPRPKRSAELDALLATIEPLVTHLTQLPD